MTKPPYTLLPMDSALPFLEFAAQYDAQAGPYRKERTRLNTALSRAGRDTPKGRRLLIQRNTLVATREAQGKHYEKLKLEYNRQQGTTGWELYRHSKRPCLPNSIVALYSDPLAAVSSSAHTTAPETTVANDSQRSATSTNPSVETTKGLIKMAIDDTRKKGLPQRSIGLRSNKVQASATNHRGNVEVIETTTHKSSNLLGIYEPSKELLQDNRWEGLGEVTRFLESSAGYKALENKIKGRMTKTADEAFGGLMLDLDSNSGNCIFNTIQKLISPEKKILIPARSVVDLFDKALAQFPNLARRQKGSVRMMVPKAGVDGGPWHLDHPLGSGDLHLTFMVKDGSLATVSSYQPMEFANPTIDTVLNHFYPAGSSDKVMTAFHNNSHLKDIIHRWGPLLLPVHEYQPFLRLRKGTLINAKTGCVHRVPPTSHETTGRVVIYCDLKEENGDEYIGQCWSRERAFLSTFDRLASAADMDDAMVFGEGYIEELAANVEHHRVTDPTIYVIATKKLIKYQDKFLLACEQSKKLKVGGSQGTMERSSKVLAAKDGLVRCLRKFKVLKESSRTVDDDDDDDDDDEADDSTGSSVIEDDGE